MGRRPFVVVFPTAFARGGMQQLARNIRAVLRIRGQGFGSVRRDGDVILVDADDPVFASSAIGLLFGIDRVAIARRAGNDLAGVASGIAEVAGSLLLRGERFLVRVGGATRGYAARDAEVAATSEIIGRRSALGARPGTERDHDRLLYAHVTARGAYVCIFVDGGRGGAPHRPGADRAVCAIYDEVSAASCYETVRQGYDARIIVCYRRESELPGLARAASRVIPALVRERADVDFYRVGVRASGAANYLAYVREVLEIMLQYEERYVSLALPALVFPAGFAAEMSRRAFEAGRIPIVPLAGADEGLFSGARELGLELGAGRIRRLAAAAPGARARAGGAARDAMRTRRRVSVPAGPNGVHDILDSLG